MEKYYIPEISEFNYGFEFEYCDVYEESIKPKENWQKVTVTQAAQIDYYNNKFKGLENAFCVRVKYLDKEDIEDCGFAEIGQEEYYLNGILTDWCIEKVSHENIKSRFRINKEHNLMFVEIKNKSDLKKLIKQLGI